MTVPVGLAHESEFRPERWHTASAIGNDGVMAVSTPAILGFLEQASLEAIAAYQGPAEVSVGAHVALDHVAPAFPGLAIRCRVKVESVVGRRVTFAVTAEQAGRTIAEGRYVRVIVPSARFHAAPSETSGEAGAPIDFWFDFHSPWSYLASLRLPEIAARHARPVRWIPIHVARLIETIEGRRPLDENPAFVRWYRHDLMRWADRTGVSIRYHPAFPLRPARALRAATYAIEQGQGPAFVRAVMRAYWSETLDISDLRVIGDLAETVGIRREDAEEAAQSPTYRAKVDDATQDAIASGVFGVPTFRTDDMLVFGNDRLDMLDEQLSTGSRTSNAADAATP